MFARNVTFQVKQGMDKDFLKVMNTEVLPLLRKQNGFRDVVALVHGDRGLGISLWNDRASAETFGAKVFPEVVQKLTPYLAGTPKVETVEVGATTLH